MDTVHIACKLLINRIYALQSKEENKRNYYTAWTELVAYDLLSARNPTDGLSWDVIFEGIDYLTSSSCFLTIGRQISRD